MVTVDDEIHHRAIDFIKRQKNAKAVLRLGQHDSHALPHSPQVESIGQSGRWKSPYHGTMIDHDKNVGLVLKALDDLGVANNTFVMYSTDNGPHMNSWPDGAMTPFRNEKNTTSKALSAFRRSFAGLARSRRVRCPTSILCRTSTGCRPFWHRPVTRSVKDKLLTGYNDR